MLEGLALFFQNLPKLLNVINKLISLLSDREALDWINSLEASVDSLQKAKDAHAKGLAAKSIASDIRGMQ